MHILLSFWMAVASAAAPAKQWVVAQKGEAKATITETDYGQRLQGPVAVEVDVTVGSRSGHWQYENWWLDPERTGEPNPEILSPRGRDYLFVHAYSGGAHCCWTLFVFDLSELQPMGRLLGGSSPIYLVPHHKACDIGAITVPNDARHEVEHLGPDLYCFDGQKFRHQRSNVGFPRRPRSPP